MTFSIHDWTGHDRVQYFTGAYVRVNTSDGAVVGSITDFTSDGKNVILMVDGFRTSFPIDSIDWDGLTPPRCIAYQDQLHFIAPLGARTTRKPVTRGNLGRMSVDNRGRCMFDRSEVPPSLVQKYLQPSPYPDTVEAAVYMASSNSYCALTPSTGMIYCGIQDPDDSHDYRTEYRIYHHAVLEFSSARLASVIDRIKTNWEVYNGR